MAPAGAGMGYGSRPGPIQNMGAIVTDAEFLMGNGLDERAVTIFRELIVNDIDRQREVAQRMVDNWGTGRWQAAPLRDQRGNAFGQFEAVIPKDVYLAWCQEDGTDRGEPFDPGRLEWAKRKWPQMAVKQERSRIVNGWTGPERTVVKRY